MRARRQVRAWYARGQTWSGTGPTPRGPSDPRMYGWDEGADAGVGNTCRSRARC
jgi:hypothetical protein